MCGQGDIQIIHNWRASHTIENLKRIVEEKGYSAISVGSFGHAALKKFDYQLTVSHCKATSGYTNQLYIWYPKSSGPSVEGSRKINPRINQELNDTARNTNDVGKIRHLVSQGADLLSTNGAMWRHTPLHQAAYHGRPRVIKVLIELARNQGVLKKNLDMSSNPCGRWSSGTPIELARGGNHHENVRLLEEAARSCDQHSEGGRHFKLSGWTGYNSRFNGKYDIVEGLNVGGKGVYQHMHSEGVGAGHDWCRVWWHHGAWRIGHVSWISGDKMLNVAHIKSDALWPGAITPRTCD